MRKRLIGLLAIAASVGTLLVAAPPASATTYTHQHAVSTWIKLATGRSYGPNSYTHYQKGTITGFVKESGVAVWDAQLHLTANPAVVVNGPRSRDVLVSPSGKVTDAVTGQIVSPMSWYNPWSWNWGGILGTLYTKLNQCAVGAYHGLVGGIAGPTFFTALMRGTKMIEITPQGVAGMAAFGCIWNIYWNS